MPSLQDLLYSAAEPQLVELPSGAIATVMEMTGADQRNFNNRAKVSNGQAVEELLQRCVDTVNGETVTPESLRNMLSGDRKALVFHIRKFSLGEDFLFRAKCPVCGKAAEWEVNLTAAEFPIRKYKNPDTRVIEAPSVLRPSVIWRFNLLDGNTELKALKMRNKADSMSDLDLRQIQAKIEVGGLFSPVNLDKLGDKLVAELRNIIREYEGEQEDEVTLTCPECQSEASFHLMGVPDFLIPGATS